MAYSAEDPLAATLPWLASVNQSKTLNDLQEVQMISPLTPGMYLGKNTLATRNIQSAPVAPNSQKTAEFVSALPKRFLPGRFHWLRTSLNTGPNGGGAKDNIPVYTVDSSNPHQEYRQFSSTDARVTNFPDLVKATSGKIPLPSWAVPSEGGDHALAIYDVATGIWRSYFKVTSKPDGSMNYSSAGYQRFDPKTRSTSNYWLSHLSGTSTVTGSATELMQLGLAELKAAKINHALSFTFPSYRRDAVFPAKVSDGKLADADAPYAGQMFTLPPNFDVDAWVKENNASAEMAAVLKAVQQYGGYVADQNFWCMALNVESPLSFKNNPYDSDPELKAAASRLNKDINKFPWEKTVWVKPGYSGHDTNAASPGIQAALAEIAAARNNTAAPSNSTTLPNNTSSLKQAVRAGMSAVSGLGALAGGAALENLFSPEKEAPTAEKPADEKAQIATSNSQSEPAPSAAPQASIPAPAPAPEPQRQPENAPSLPMPQSRKHSGLMLDVARQFYPLNTLKGYVDDIARAGGTFFHLHLSDDQNYALESATLGQLARNAKQNADGSYINPATGKSFYSAAQIQELVHYAKQKGIELVPEIDAPAHMSTIHSLLQRENSAQASQIFNGNNELRYESAEAQQFIQQLYDEAADMFAGSGMHFHIGGDEFSGSISQNPHYIAYVNNIVLHLKNKNLIVRVWNDAILKTSLTQLDNSVEITYWDRDGNRESQAQRDENIANRATVLDLIQAGYRVLNYNQHYLYHIISADSQHNAQHNAAQVSAADWHIGIWDEQNHNNAVDASLMDGAAVAVWADEDKPYTINDNTLRGYIFPHLKAVADKVKAAEK